MNVLKLYFKSVKNNFILEQIMLMILIFLGMSISMKLQGVFMVLILGVLSKMDSSNYELLCQLANRTADNIKLCYLSVYGPVVLAYSLLGIFNKSNILQVIYQLALMLIYINIIIPVSYISGMKKNELGVIVLTLLSMIIIFYILTSLLKVDESARLLEVAISMILTIVTLQLSYKVSVRRIYGK